MIQYTWDLETKRNEKESAIHVEPSAQTTDTQERHNTQCQEKKDIYEFTREKGNSLQVKQRTKEWKQSKKKREYVVRNHALKSQKEKQIRS